MCYCSMELRKGAVAQGNSGTRAQRHKGARVIGDQRLIGARIVLLIFKAPDGISEHLKAEFFPYLF